MRVRRVTLTFKRIFRRKSSRHDDTMDSKRRLLLVDDDRELCALMHEFFGQHGLFVETAASGAEGLRVLSQSPFDLVVLDVMMPLLDGFEVLRQIRKRSTVPVIMLTARTSEEDRIGGLNAGADDYLPKPFAPDELLARIRAVLRRAARADISEEQVIDQGGIRLEPRLRRVWIEGQPANLTAIEFDILECLMSSAGRVVSRDAIAAALYQRPSSPYERAIDVHISHLRKKLQGRGLSLIHTLRGSGYIFTPQEVESE